MDDERLIRVAALERRLRLALAVNAVLLISFLSMVGLSCRTAAIASSRPQALTVSELDVVDPQGVIRARVGGDLPDAVFNGRRVPRGQKAAGVMLYDNTGHERGGYITFSPGRQVALTLDNRARQTAILAAGVWRADRR